MALWSIRCRCRRRAPSARGSSSRSTSMPTILAAAPSFKIMVRVRTAMLSGGLRGKAERLIKRQFVGTAGRPGLSTVMIEAFQVVQDRITRSRLAGDPPDVLISPRLGRINLFDFHRADEIIALGAEATEKALEPIAEA